MDGSVSAARWRVGFDIGGTFTDFILYDAAEGAVTLHKRLTTPHDPAEAALKGLAELVEMRGITLTDVSEMVHGTTLVTNPYWAASVAVSHRPNRNISVATLRGMLRGKR